MGDCNDHGRRHPNKINEVVEIAVSDGLSQEGCVATVGTVFFPLSPKAFRELPLMGGLCDASNTAATRSIGAVSRRSADDWTAMHKAVMAAANRAIVTFPVAPAESTRDDIWVARADVSRNDESYCCITVAFESKNGRFSGLALEAAMAEIREQFRPEEGFFIKASSLEADQEP